MEISFLHGLENHIREYERLISNAKNQIIIASWTICYIPPTIYKRLAEAKERGIRISFIVGNDKSGKGNQFYTFETVTHSKFLIVDFETLIVGSFNALCESDGLDSSIKISGNVKELWPFVMSIYETYTTISDINEIRRVFGDSVHTSRSKQNHPRKFFTMKKLDEDLIILLRNKKEHDMFFEVISSEKSIIIFSPFFTKSAAKQRIKILNKNLPTNGQVVFNVRKNDMNILNNMLSRFPKTNSFNVRNCESHQKIIIVNDDLICVGSLNWLSMPQNLKDDDSNVEFSIVIHGLKAKEIIKNFV
jgi:phosphatidylserine/phosphatidylglycerophosphate/cardiolipin synthase-like enzyme